MKCLHCAHEIPVIFFEEWSKTSDIMRGHFKCPKCKASHLRQLADHTADGRPIYEFRLWGHPATTRRILRIESGKAPAATA